jgi:hypothetical protein
MLRLAARSLRVSSLRSGRHLGVPVRQVTFHIARRRQAMAVLSEAVHTALRLLVVLGNIALGRVVYTYGEGARV